MLQYDFGDPLLIASNLNLSDATAVRVVVVSPAGVEIEYTLADIEVTINDAATGLVYVVPADGDITEVGVYRVQVLDETPGRRRTSNVGFFETHDCITTIPTPA